MIRYEQCVYGHWVFDVWVHDGIGYAELQPNPELVKRQTFTLRRDGAGQWMRAGVQSLHDAALVDKLEAVYEAIMREVVA